MATLITGANRGIGHALAVAEARAGRSVIGTHRGAPPATAQVTWQPLDLTDPEAPAAMAARLGPQPVELLVCNAGIYPDKGQALDTGYAAALWTETFAVNVTGVFLTVQALLPHLARAQAPKLAIIASQMGSSERARGGGGYIYRASKAAVINLGRNLAVDLAPRGIAVGIYHPGWVRTDMGGADGDIDTDTAVAGLRRCFDRLSLASTGCFLSYDGTPHPF